MPMRDSRIPGIVRHERLRASLSVAKLARLSGVSRSTIWRIETARSAPEPWTLMALLHVTETVAPHPPRPLTAKEKENVRRFVASARRLD